MSIWSRIVEAISALTAGEGLSAVFEKLTTPPDRSVGFAIAVIALGAKMAKADGEVTRDEVRAFREVFYIAPGDEASAARVFNLARQDVAGFDAYARQVARMFETDKTTLENLLEGLFHIAVANGEFHPGEEEFLHEVAMIFGLSERCFSALRIRFVPNAEPDPYDVLKVQPDAPMSVVRTAWRDAVRENHPDRAIARGVPREAVHLAEERMVAINRAWEAISRDRAA